jgi:hypothetical protein
MTKETRSIKRVDSIVESVVDKFIERAEFGRQKYGTDLDRTDLDLEDYLEHALQEHMDAILYLTKALKLERERKSKEKLG